jgi:hypothetical protein
MRKVNLQKTLTLLPSISASVAANWHLHMVPAIESNLNELRDLKSQMDDQDADIIDGIESDIREYESALATINEAWPAPVVTDIYDGVPREVSADVFADAFKNTPLTQSLPSEPMALITHGKWGNAHSSGTLLYRNEAGQYFKVPNISYNQPNKRQHFAWDDRYAA